MPALSLSAVWKTARRWEMVLTGGISWCHHKVIQYGTFGIDPQGAFVVKDTTLADLRDREIVIKLDSVQ